MVPPSDATTYIISYDFFTESFFSGLCGKWNLLVVIWEVLPRKTTLWSTTNPLNLDLFVSRKKSAGLFQCKDGKWRSLKRTVRPWDFQWLEHECPICMEVELLVSGRARRNNYMGCPTLISTTFHSSQLPPRCKSKRRSVSLTSWSMKSDEFEPYQKTPPKTRITMEKPPNISGTVPELEESSPI